MGHFNKAQHEEIESLSKTLAEPIAIEAVAEVRQVKTMADFTVSVTLNLPETCKEQAKKFMDWQGKMIRLVAVVEDV